MTQEDKQLLLADLCARLPYGVVLELDEKFGFNKGTHVLVKELLDSYCVEGIKPYLRPMSSMTEEEEKEYINIDNRSYSCPMAYAHIPASDRIDWLNAHHFDYRGLIKKGLAIAVTENNNPYKE